MPFTSMSLRCFLIPLTALGLLAVSPSESARADTPVAADDVKTVMDKAIDSLKARQNADGSFAPKLGGPGITALVAAGLIRNGRADDPVVAKALKYLESNVKEDGSIQARGLANYTTCVAVMAFKEANTGGKYDQVIANATKFLKSLQQNANPNDVRYGGVGYDGGTRPDLSNTSYFVEALLTAGVPKSDPAIQKALAFISRCQNLPGEAQDQEFAKKATEDDKGGFVYNPQDATNPKAEEHRTPQGGLRSAGVMGYSGLKSFLYAGVGRDDPRVKAAIDWIRRHYSVDENPGQKEAGLFYYYHTFAKAMDALGQESFEDANGKKHNWRRDLFEALKKRQKEDGSWANTNRTFLENTPELATAYALLSLSYCSKK